MRAIRVLLSLSVAAVIGVIGSSTARGASNAQMANPQLIYAANGFPATASITEYRFDADGDVSPVATISGPDTGLLFGVAGLSVDSNGYLYAATSAVGASPNAIVVYAPGANGDTPPARTLTASSYGGVWSVATAVDKNGDLWVANLNLTAIEEFAPGASGDAAPIRTIEGPATGLVKPSGIAISDRGDVWVADLGAAKVMRFGPSQSGNVAPKQVIAGPVTGLNEPVGVSLGPGTLWVSNVSIIPEGTVREFSSIANGDVAPIRVINPLGQQPFALNGGPVDVAGDVIFPCLTGGQSSAVLVYRDDVASTRGYLPLRVINGQNTGLVSTGWIAVH
ncbi:MAG TPA: hypothetical protein VFO25_12655 [Candidatus Eremiobacteraceae bacterium]|nr:hypothetical protein [Candidatus Eremiobacteraceae bacterium]